MPQNEHIELHRKRHGRQLNYEEKKRKKEAREVRFTSKCLAYALSVAEALAFSLSGSSSSSVWRSSSSGADGRKRVQRSAHFSARNCMRATVGLISLK
jgi:ribosomal protein S8E